MHNKESIIITGVSGHVGSAVAEEFLKRGWSVVGTSREKRRFSFPVIKTDYDIKDLIKIFDKHQPKLLVHTAGTANVGGSFNFPDKDYQGSVELFHNLLEGIRRSRIRPRVVFISSAAVYGNPNKFPITEETKLQPISPYGYHKKFSEEMAYEYHKLYQIPVLVVRLFSTFGPKQHRLLLWEIFNQAENKNKIVIQGTGKEERDYLYVSDIARTLFDLVEKNKEDFNMVNIASGKPHTVKEMAEKILLFMGIDKSIEYLGNIQKGNPISWRVNVENLENMIGREMLKDIYPQLRQCIVQWQEK